MRPSESINWGEPKQALLLLVSMVDELRTQKSPEETGKESPPLGSW